MRSQGTLMCYIAVYPWKAGILYQFNSTFVSSGDWAAASWYSCLICSSPLLHAGMKRGNRVGVYFPTWLDIHNKDTNNSGSIKEDDNCSTLLWKLIDLIHHPTSDQYAITPLYFVDFPGAPTLWCEFISRVTMHPNILSLREVGGCAIYDICNDSIACACGLPLRWYHKYNTRGEWWLSWQCSS